MCDLYIQTNNLVASYWFAGDLDARVNQALEHVETVLERIETFLEPVENVLKPVIQLLIDTLFDKSKYFKKIKNLVLTRAKSFENCCRLTCNKNRIHDIRMDYMN